MQPSTTSHARCLFVMVIALVLGFSALCQDRAETGVASWYGEPYHGRPAANGEIYDMDTLTAAHPTLPFNTKVRVLNLDNGRTVDVRVADRGPFVGGRIIDVSKAAASQIGLIESGTARVRVEVLEADALPTPTLLPVSFAAPAPRLIARPIAQPAPGGQFGVQTGAFRNPDNARRFAALMQERYGVARLEHTDGSPIWRVIVGAETSREGAQSLASKIDENNAFVVRLISSDDSKQPESRPEFSPGRTVAGDGLHPPIN